MFHYDCNTDKYWTKEVIKDQEIRRLKDEIDRLKDEIDRLKGENESLKKNGKIFLS